MDFRPILEDEWQDLRNSLYSHEQIRSRVMAIVGWLGAIFNNAQPGGVAGVEFRSKADGDVICQVATPIGQGRIRLDWTLLRKELHGVLIVEKALRDEFDRIQWVCVWQLKVPETPNVFIAAPGDGYSFRAGRQRENDVFALGMSILFAILNGPVTQ